MFETINFSLSNIWILICSCLVFIMHLGFAALETGLTRSKNTVNILFKNVGVLSIGILSFALIGFNLMYPGEAFSGSFFGLSGIGLITDNFSSTSLYNPNYTFYTDFIFQAMFAATAATIVSGAVAERMKLGPFLIFALLLVAISYPITGMWHWGGGFLSTLKTPFHDFAGSTIVHSVGGWAALAAVLFLGPRLGRYDKLNSIRPHSFALASIGVLLLWFGWFGFNAGSVLSADPQSVSLVFINTLLGGASGTFFAKVTSWVRYKRPDLLNTLNGTLAGLVSVTAGADVLTPLTSFFVAALGGVLVVFSAEFFNNRQIDDPVGAISVHLIVGIWGTLAVGLFSNIASFSQVLSQLVGILFIGAFTLGFSCIVLLVLSKVYGLRVSSDHEIEGLDRSEHKDLSYTYCFDPVVINKETSNIAN